MRLSPRALFLVGVALLYAPWLFLGYGADDDAYRIIRTGRVLLEEGTYVGSRNPGYLVPELGTMVLNALGGSVLANAGTLALGLIALGAFLSLAERLAVPHRFLLAAGFALHPVFWSNATASMDHVWALGFLLAGWLALLDRRWVGAGVLLALAVGSRFTLAPAVGLVLGYAWLSERAERAGVGRAAGLAVLLGAACYLPSAWEFGWTLGFLEPAGLGGAELWTWPLRLGRWGYKNVYFWGLGGTLALAGFAVLAVRHPERRRLLALVAAVVLAYEALYLRFPLDVGYLLPMLPFVLLGLGVVLAARRAWLVAFVVLVASYNLVSVNLARPDQPFGASDAAFGLWVEPGFLWQQTRIRLLTRDCTVVACWEERMGFNQD